LDDDTHSKLVAKLLEINKLINNGAEISGCKYIGRIDPDSEFFKAPDMQSFVKRSNYEEFKIFSLNYLILLFNSVPKLAFALDFKDHQGELEDKLKLQIMNPNLKKFA